MLRCGPQASGESWPYGAWGAVWQLLLPTDNTTISVNFTDTVYKNRLINYSDMQNCIKDIIHGGRLCGGLPTLCSGSRISSRLRCLPWLTRLAIGAAALTVSSFTLTIKCCYNCRIICLKNTENWLVDDASNVHTRCQWKCSACQKVGVRGTISSTEVAPCRCEGRQRWENKQ